MTKKTSCYLHECVEPELRDIQNYITDCQYSNSVKPDMDMVQQMLTIARLKLNYYSNKYELQAPDDELFLSNNLEDFLKSLHKEWSRRDSSPLEIPSDCSDFALCLKIANLREKGVDIEVLLDGLEKPTLS